MANEFQVSFEGTTGNEPDVGQTHGGKAATSVNVAVTPRVKRGDDFVDGTTSWVETRLYGPVAENAAASLPKGSRVVVTGRMFEEEFERRDGSKGRKLVCLADSIGASLRFATAQIARRERGSGGQQRSQSQGDAWAQPSQGQAWGQQSYGDDTPF